MEKLRPFSNSTEAELWMSHNCDSCDTSRNCSAKRNIELGYITGTITIKAAQFIGTTFLKENYCTLSYNCQNRDKRIVKKYKRTKLESSLTLF